MFTVTVFVCAGCCQRTALAVAPEVLLPPVLVWLWNRVSHWPRAQQWLGCLASEPWDLPISASLEMGLQTCAPHLAFPFNVSSRKRTQALTITSWTLCRWCSFSSAFKSETFEDDVCISKAWEACWELGLTLGQDSMQRTRRLWIQMNYITTNFLSRIPGDPRKMENMKLQSVSFHIGNFCHSYKTLRWRPGVGVQGRWRQEVRWVCWAASRPLKNDS